MFCFPCTIASKAFELFLIGLLTFSPNMFYGGRNKNKIHIVHLRFNKNDSLHFYKNETAQIDSNFTNDSFNMQVLELINNKQKNLIVLCFS